MKRSLVALLALLVAGSILGHFMLQGSGYILISFQDWVIETSLWVFILTLLASVLAIYGAIHLINNVLKTPSVLQDWRGRRGINVAIAKTVRGLMH